jgi:lambda family phage portal protein
MTSVMMKVKDFDDFEDAQLMQQKVAACFAAFITKESDDTATASDDNDDDNTERIEPGIIEHLHQGEEVSFANPPSTSGQETFGRMTLRGIAAGAGLSYETLSGDLSNVNFSSGRMGWLEMHRNISEWQERIMITQFCDPIWSWFIQGAKIAGKTKDDQIAASWTPPRREMIDPVKEVNGLTTLCQAGFDSYQNTLRTLGLDPEVVLKQMADDIKNFDANGIKVSSDYRQLLLKLQKNG